MILDWMTSTRPAGGRGVPLSLSTLKDFHLDAKCLLKTASTGSSAIASFTTHIIGAIFDDPF